MKKEEEFINEYLEGLGIIPLANDDEFETHLKNNIGAQDAELFLKQVSKRGDGSRSSSIYKIANESLEKSIAFFGGFDYYYLQKLFSLFNKNKKYFGKRILDVGCNNGVTTCFIAKCHPESEVIGIDIVKQAVEVAEELAKKLGLSNVKFIKKNANNLNDKFDTVVMSKVSHEMIICETDKWYAPREEIINDFKYKFYKVAKLAKKLLADDGNLIMFDRMPWDFATYGYYKALCECGLYPQMSTYEHTAFYQLGDEEKMPFVVANSIGEKSEEAITSYFNKLLDEQENSLLL